MNSGSHLLQVVGNIFLSGKLRDYIAKKNLSQSKLTFKSYLRFVVIALILFIANQTFYFYVKPLNLYQELQVPRSFSLQQVKQHGDNLKIRIMSLDHMPMNIKLQKIKKLEDMVKVLSHPARRLSYDTFGYSDTQYAWAFKSQQFLISVIISSGIFYIMCTVMSLISQKKNQSKQVLKTQIVVMVLLFVWELDLIMSAETRLHSNHTDFLDNIYRAFPIFQRRQMIKAIVIPCMNLVFIFVQFYIKSDSYVRVSTIGNYPKLRAETNKLLQAIKKCDQKNEESINAALAPFEQKQPLSCRIYTIQRQILKIIVRLNKQSILFDKHIMQIMQYYKINLETELK